jgi:competence protein ComFA
MRSKFYKGRYFCFLIRGKGLGRLLFYMIHTESNEFHLTPIIEMHKLQMGCEVLLPGLPFGFAQFIFQELKRRGKLSNQVDVLGFLKKLPGLSGQNYRWDNVSLGNSSDRENIDFRLDKTQDNLLDKTQDNLKEADEGEKYILKAREFSLRSQNRQLSESDLQRLGQEIGFSYQEVLKLCTQQVQAEQAEWVPAVTKVGRGWQCMRCGETQVKEWPSIYGLAATCPACASLGALSSLQVLYRSLSCSSSPLKRIEFSPRWELSSAQKLVSEEVEAFVASSEDKRARKNRQELLLWAACGAGKTEVCFPAAAWALNQGQRVLFAAPRQDVVHDVVPRLKRDFPDLAVSVFSGISPERFAPAQFVLATTHQVLRFYHAFDLIFLDEMDAFPYQGNGALAWGLRQSLKSSGKMVYLTATPSREVIEKVKRGQMQIVRLPARHHRTALPVPEWSKFSWEFVDGGQKISDLEIRGLARWVKDLAMSGPVLIFVPKISWINPLVGRLRQEFPQWEIAGSYSSDPCRKVKIEGLRSKKYQAFISTSILERGVTVPDVQVIVLSADHNVFDERALVQMAGRVGRTQENPGGRAVFLAKKRTPEIEKAISWIKEQNTLAQEQGLLD